MEKIKVLQVHEKFFTEKIEEYTLTDFEGERLNKTLCKIYGLRGDKKTEGYIMVREVLSRIAPAPEYVWYRSANDARKKTLLFYKDQFSAD